MKTLLIANRGEIARRIMRTAKRVGLRTVAIYSRADRDALHVREADAAVCIAGATPSQSYLDIGRIIQAAKNTGADAIHPGYGFLAENAVFAECVIAENITWVGPMPQTILDIGDKALAKFNARKLGIPVVPGDPLFDDSDVLAVARTVGFPLMIKAVAGGGGRGMRRVTQESDLAAAVDAARSEAENAFGYDGLLLERALDGVRHIEVQIFGDGHGHVVHLGERDCSLQRRHQKLIEEQPSPAINLVLRDRICDAAVRLAADVEYAGAGTAEFLLDADGQFYFMEMNTRLQVEHPVTEAVTGIDLVEWQLRLADNEPFTTRQSDISFSGHAIEARLCAEDPKRDFLPQTGRIALWQPAAGVRTDHAIESGAEVSPFYDSMIAKVIAHGATRDEALIKLAHALDETVILGITTNKSFLVDILRDKGFARRGVTTDFLANRPASQINSTPLFAAAALLANSAPYGEWTCWSNKAERDMLVRFGNDTVHLRFRDGGYAIRTRASGSELRLRVAAIDPTHARVVTYHDEGIVTFAIEGDTIHIATSGRDFRWRDPNGAEMIESSRPSESFSLTNTIHASPAKAAAGAVDGRLIAPMNGRVVAVNAKAGDTVEAGRALIVLEAMKMEHALSVPAASRVKAVHVAAGAQVKPGQLLAELEPA